jgi:hypothetical protein
MMDSNKVYSIMHSSDSRNISNYLTPRKSMVFNVLMGPGKYSEDKDLGMHIDANCYVTATNHLAAGGNGNGNGNGNCTEIGKVM